MTTKEAETECEASPPEKGVWEEGSGDQAVQVGTHL